MKPSGFIGAAYFLNVFDFAKMFYFEAGAHAHLA